MQFNLVNDQERVEQVVWRGMAWCGVALCCIVLVLGFIAAGAAALVAWAFISLWSACPGRLQALLAVSGSFAY